MLPLYFETGLLPPLIKNINEKRRAETLRLSLDILTYIILISSIHPVLTDLPEQAWTDQPA